jgi:glycosyltransferase involved in cell wall biosynthesis
MIIGLQRRGFDVEVMTPADCYYATRMAEAGIRIYDFLPQRKVSAKAIRRIRSTLLAGKHAVLYMFNNPAIANGLLAASGLPVKTVAYRGQVGNISRYNPLAYLTHMSPRLDRIVCVANAVRDSLRSQLWNPSKAVTIYKGHDIGWYADVQAADLTTLGIPKDAFVFVCVANNRPRKGVPVLVEATSHLPENTPIHILLIGSGMDGKETRALVARSPLAGHFHLLGHRNDVLELVASAQASVLPALRREGLPKTVIESMALGVVPVVTATGGSPELVTATTGLVVPPGDPRSLAMAMTSLADDAERARRMGQAATERLKTEFSLQTSIQQHASLFTELARQL